MSSPSSTSTCATCKKTASDLKRCAACQVTAYCSRECQKADWKSHKRTCGGWVPTSAPDMLKSLFDDDELRKLSQDKLYERLIDCYRMRVEDEFVWGGNAMGLHAEEDPVEGFMDFLKLAEEKKGVLPDWWSMDKKQECVNLGSKRNGWSSLHHTIEKSEVMEHYNDNFMPMNLRILAERIYGKPIGAL